MVAQIDEFNLHVGARLRLLLTARSSSDEIVGRGVGALNHSAIVLRRLEQSIAAQLAPQAFASAEAERANARKAQADGDQVAALLYADRAVAACDVPALPSSLRSWLRLDSRIS